ncbi:hypothetical protein ABBQ32_012695 [Trebouxia sp. C0010 RCD-2024]
MADEQVVKQLVDRLSTEESSAQQLTAEEIKELAQSSLEYATAFGQHGAIEPLVGLLDDPSKPTTLLSAQALACMVACEPCCSQIRDAGAISSLVALLQPGVELPSDLLKAVLKVLLGLAHDELSCDAIQQASGIPRIIKLLEYAKDDQAAEVQQAAALLLGQLGISDVCKAAIKNSFGIVTLLKMIGRLGLDRSSKEVVVRTISVLAVDNEVNQDHIREQYGIPALVKLLEATPFDGVTAAAADALRALAMNNDTNKTAIREAWAVPLLVKLLGSEVDMAVTEKAVDCLRILTTGNEANKVALLTSASGLPCLVRLMETSPDQLVIERAAAVVGNLSTNDQFFSAIREAGAIQRLVRLLDSGSTHRTTEIAAKTLANLASESSNRKGIRLAGGVPPLMRLLMDRPSEQVMIAVDEALRRLEISAPERNAILEAFRYADARNAAAMPSAVAAAQQEAAAAAEAADGHQQAAAPALTSKPFTRYTVAETVQLLSEIGIRDGSPFETNGITGGDLLDLDDEELKEDLHLTNLQAKKIRRVQSAFDMFNRMMQTPGKAELTLTELRNFLTSVGRAESDTAAIANGFKQGLQKQNLATFTFAEFLQCYQWLLKTLHLMEHSHEGFELPRANSMRGLSASSSLTDASPQPLAQNGN